MDPDIFIQTLSNEHFVDGAVNDLADRLDDAMRKSCDASMPRRRRSSRRKENYWWNQEIAKLRKECLKTRHIYQRGRSRPGFEEKKQAYHQARKKLKKAIYDSKSKCFKQLCAEADSNPWGSAYRVVMARLKGKKSAQITCPILIRNIIETLFPKGDPYVDTVYNRNTSTPDPIEEREILKLCSKIATRKLRV